MSAELKSESRPGGATEDSPKKCPSCGAPIPAGTPECPRCSLTVRSLDVKFGMIPLHSSYVTDRCEVLSLHEIEKLRQLLERFETKFPQSLFSVFVAELPPGHPVGEYAFWLANRAKFNPLEVHAENCNLLLVVDLRARVAALAVGYGLEEYLSEDDLKDALEKFSDLRGPEDLPVGIRACVEWITHRLRKLARAPRRAAPRKAVKDDVPY